MRSCHLPSASTATFSTTAMFPQKFYFCFSPIFRPRVLGRSVKFRRLFDRIRPLPVVTASINSVIASGNVIAAAAAVASGSGSVHGAVTSAITHVAVTAVAIASGACLSTKVDFLWPKVEEKPGSLVLDGVDVTGLVIFEDAKVQKAIEFAKKAHHGQLRKTGDPYLTHCIHTGRILAALVPPSGNRAVDTVVAGILHDIVDDTCQNLHSIEEEFGDEVTKLVAGVSRLSYINQLLRRHRRVNVNQGSLDHEEANKLRIMLLGMVDDPRVVLIKLADRLHNMRTIYALPLPKAQAVAQETLVIWCSLASRLGLWALKAELEDLCFAVLQPQMFLKLRSELASMWMPSSRAGSFRKVSARADLPLLDKDSSTCYHNMPVTTTDEATNMKELLEAVVPFDILADRRKRTSYLNNLQRSIDTCIQPKVVQDARNALASLLACEEALEQELIISASYVPGMEVTLSSRLKSLYSIYSKMKRKDISIDKVYDARALRVVVGDKNGTLHGPAVQCCYSLLNTVHKLWSPIDGEFDDYIVNPKPSGYQSLHTAVIGPDNSPLEVQIRTQRMHEYAEHGLAAHWLYKENGNKIPSSSSKNESERDVSRCFSDSEFQNSIGDYSHKYGFLKAGHPVLRVEGSHLLAAVIIRVDEDGRELLVAVSFGLGASEAVADRRSTFQIKRWEAYARLYKKVSDEWWCEPGHGDWCTCLERYTLCRDGIYHKQDQFGRLLPTFIQVIDFTEREESEYWAIMSAISEGKQIDSTSSRTSSVSVASISPDASINTKVHFLRTMLQWEEQLLCEASNLRQAKHGGEYYVCRSSFALEEVVIVCWPLGEIMRLRSGSTAADAARRVGSEGRLVLINGLPVLPSTELKDGDVVEVRV
ncbi:putative GTP diphosphokinase RSH3, chloroplastic, partial [Cucurbita argyrosperma subsp. sororia]